MTDTTADNGTETTRDYRPTLFLPETDFPMRAGLPKREPEWLARWEELNVYENLRAQSEDRERWVLHDGPPYANGHIHIGTGQNKILKDIVVRSHQMLGFDAPYRPPFFHRFFDAFFDRSWLDFCSQLGSQNPSKSEKNRCQDAFPS